MQVSRFARKGLFALAAIAGALSMSAPAFATYCNNGATNYPACNNNTPPPTPTPPGTTNTSTANGGDASAGALAGALAGAAAGANASTGEIKNTNTANGGTGGQGGQGGAGGQASSNGTNLGINGQQQGIAGSGNSDNTNKNANTAAQGQGQGQGQGQQQSATGGANSLRLSTSLGQSTNAGNGAGASAGAGAGASAGQGAGAGAGSGNKTANTTRVDASDRSSTNYESKTTVWAPVIHGAGAAPLAAANLVIVPGACTPYAQQVVSTPLVGKRFGVWGGQDDVHQGLNDRAEYVTYKDTAGQPIAAGFVRIGNALWGERTTRALAVVGTSSGGSFSIGGFGKNGDGGQGGGAASGQLQQIAVHAWVEKCAAYEFKAEVSAPVATPEAPRPVVQSVRE